MMVGIILVIDWASENPQKIDKKEDLE